MVRLGRALELLRDGSMSVREVSEAVGFRDQYHFSHRFRASFEFRPQRVPGSPTSSSGSGRAAPRRRAARAPARRGRAGPLERSTVTA
jgi:AraC-like DNA-binding protein